MPITFTFKEVPGLYLQLGGGSRKSGKLHHAPVSGERHHAPGNGHHRPAGLAERSSVSHGSPRPRVPLRREREPEPADAWKIDLELFNGKKVAVTMTEAMEGDILHWADRYPAPTVDELAVMLQNQSLDKHGSRPSHEAARLTVVAALHQNGRPLLGTDRPQGLCHVAVPGWNGRDDHYDLCWDDIDAVLSDTGPRSAIVDSLHRTLLERDGDVWRRSEVERIVDAVRANPRAFER